MKDSLGDRMKSQYENRTRHMLPRRTYTILRVDGKAFHTYTRGMEKPFDGNLARCLDWGATKLCEEAQGAKLAYIQSDEISVLLTDFAQPNTEAWFDGNLQKQCSVAASIVTVAFNDAMNRKVDRLATFDCRVFAIPDPVEVENYFIWRQKDAERNSLSGLAQKHYSAKELHGADCRKMHDMLHEKGVNWNDLTAYWKRGRCVVRFDGAWSMDHEIPVFTQKRGYLESRVPRQWADLGTEVVDGTDEEQDGPAA